MCWGQCWLGTDLFIPRNALTEAISAVHSILLPLQEVCSMIASICEFSPHASPPSVDSVAKQVSLSNHHALASYCSLVSSSRHSARILVKF